MLAELGGNWGTDGGWEWPTFDRVRLKPGNIGVITRIDKGMYLYLDDERGGFHWECFKKVLFF
jgi:hypothetical protein